MKVRSRGMLTKGEVKEFKELVLEAYNVVLTDEEAMDQGLRLIQLFELILKSKNQGTLPLQILRKRVNNE